MCVINRQYNVTSKQGNSKGDLEHLAGKRKVYITSI